VTSEQKKLADEWERTVGGSSDGAARRVPMPLSSRDRIKRDVTTEVKAIAHLPFRPERYCVSDACEDYRGPWWKRLWPWYRAPQQYGSADWLIRDILIDGKSQFTQTGDLPGDMFRSSAIDSFVVFGECPSGAEIVVKATYIGPHPKGQRFYSGMVGMQRGSQS
jgi:hypothetical protein